MTTIRALRSAVARRHEPAGRAFWAAALAALAGAGASPERALAALAEAAADGAAAPSVEAWLAAIAVRCGADPVRALAHADRVEAALAGVRVGAEPRPPARQRILASLRSTSDGPCAPTLASLTSA